MAVALVAVVALRLSGWSSGPYAALLLVGLPVVLLPAYLLLALALLRRDWVLGAVAAGLVTAHLLVISPGLGAADVPQTAVGAPRLRVVTANVLSDNPDLERLAASLRALDADVLVVVELRPRVLEALRRAGVLDDLPYTTTSGRPGDVELFSRLPLRNAGHTEAARDLPQPRAVVEVGGVDVRLRGAHPLPPVHESEDEGRASLQGLREEVRAEGLPMVVAGDLNGDRDFPLFRALLDEGLRDAAEERGRGLSRTWPQALPVLALDHVLVRDGRGGRLVVLSQREADLPGSDHRAVVADLAVLPTG